MGLKEWLFGKPEGRSAQQRALDVWAFLASQHPHRTEVGLISRVTGMTEGQARQAMGELVAVGAIETFGPRFGREYRGVALSGPPHKRPAEYQQSLRDVL